MWLGNGVLVCNAVNQQEYSVIASDGAGGAIVAWADFRSGLNIDIYVQRLNAAGARQWGATGVPLSSGDNGWAPAIVADGGGGAIVAWHDLRSGAADIYARRVDASGVAQWTADGVALCLEAGNQFFPKIVSDGAGGAIETWQDGRGPDRGIFAQGMSAAGVPQWHADGVPLCTKIGDQQPPRIATDGAGGAIVTWQDGRDPSTDIYTQRVNAAGVAQWIADGVSLCTAANS